MAKRKLRAELDFETARACANQRRFGQGLDQTNEKLREGQAATDGLTRRLLALGGTYMSVQALVNVVSQLIDAYSRAIQIRDDFTQRGMGIMGGMAPAAAQFGVPEAQMAALTTAIAGPAGAGPGARGGIGDLLVALSSAGALPPGAITRGAGALPQVGPGVVPGVTALTRFAGWAGLGGGQYDALAKITARGLGGQPLTEPGALRVLGQLHAAFTRAEATNWGTFLEGMVGPLAAKGPVGIPFEASLAEYSALVATRHRPISAGESSRLLAEQLFIADRPEIVSWIGADRYWRLKQQAPGALYGEIINRLTEPTGAARAQLYRRLKIAPELGGRLAQLAGVLPEQRAIRGALGAVEPEAIGGILAEWRAGPRPTYEALGGVAAAMGEVTDLPSARAAGFREIAAKEQERLQMDEPAQQWIRDAWRTKPTELNMAFLSYLRRRYREMYGADMPWDVNRYLPRITGDEVRFRGPYDDEIGYDRYLEAFPKMAPILSPNAPTTQPAGGTTIINAPANMYVLPGAGQGVTPNPRASRP